MINSDLFLPAQEGFEGEFRLVLDFIIECYNLMIEAGISLENHEERIRDRLVCDWLNNRAIRRQLGMSEYLFEAETCEYNSHSVMVGYCDIKVLIKNYTFDDPSNYFIIECKRLDGSARLNREYVNEGIFRFTDSTKYSTFSGLNGMIGFCVSRFDCDENIRKINKKLKKSIPVNYTTKYLTKVVIHQRFDSVFLSSHYKDNLNSPSNFNIYHLMFDYSNSVII